MNLNYDIASIEGALYAAVGPIVAPTVVYPSRRPSSATSDLDAFVVVRVVTGIKDRTAFGEAVCALDVYVKGRSGMKDAGKMASLMRKLMAALPLKAGPYTFSFLSNISLGLDATGYDVESVNVDILIK